MSPWPALPALDGVSRETLERIAVFVDRLETWQRKTNLVAPSTLEAVWERHVIDSLQCVLIKPEARRWLDLGSGGGFPGLVIAAAMADFPDSTVTLVESNRKKCAFLRQVARQMGVRVQVLDCRIEDVRDAVPVPQVVTARALAGLPKLLSLGSPWLTRGAVGLFHKGREYREELADCDGLWRFDLVSHQSRITPDSVVLEISNLSSVKP